MPHSTIAYPFEWKVCTWAGQLGRARTGALRAFVLNLVPDGAGSRFLVDTVSEDWREARERRRAAGQSFLFFDPFDAPEYVWLEWFCIDRPAMERLLEQAFGDADFISARDGTCQPYPGTWRVMF